MPLEENTFNDLLNMLKSDSNTKTPQVSPPLLPQEPPEEKNEAPKTKPKACQHVACKKKLMLSDFACRCENYYCGSHRHAESHSCAYDFKKQGATQLEKQLVKAVASKLDRLESGHCVGVRVY